MLDTWPIASRVISAGQAMVPFPLVQRNILSAFSLIIGSQVLKVLQKTENESASKQVKHSSKVVVILLLYVNTI